MTEKERLWSLVKDIKRKRELQPVEDSYVAERVGEFLTQNPKIASELAERRDFERFKRSGSYKRIIKYARAVLHRNIGAYCTRSYKKNKQLLKSLGKLLEKGLNSEESLALHRQILGTHSSTRERVLSYEVLYKRLFEISGKPKIILDLGCGLNPLSFPWMGLKNIEYHAVDINNNDLELVKEYFEIIGERCCIKRIDLQKGGDMAGMFPKADICFLFKVLECIDQKNHKPSEAVIKQLAARFVVASFATRTLSGRRMRQARRVWLEQMLRRLGFEFRIFREGDEIFYLIQKEL